MQPGNLRSRNIASRAPLPIRIRPRVKVVRLDAALSMKAPAQPTIQDVLNALQDLSKKISQLSDNQQSLQTSIEFVSDAVTIVDQNLVNVANLVNSIATYGAPLTGNEW